MVASLGWFGWRSWDYSKIFLDEETLWENVSTVNKRSYRAFANLAALANNHGQPETALKLIERSLAMRPQYLEGMVIKGYALDLMEKPVETAALYRKALASDPRNAVWLFLLAGNLERSKRFSEAEAVFDEITRVQPGYVAARLAAGLLAAQMGQLEKATSHWRAGQAIAPENTVARHNLELLSRQTTRP